MSFSDELKNINSNPLLKKKIEQEEQEEGLTARLPAMMKPSEKEKLAVIAKHNDKTSSAYVRWLIKKDIEANQELFD